MSTFPRAKLAGPRHGTGACPQWAGPADPSRRNAGHCWGIRLREKHAGTAIDGHAQAQHRRLSADASRGRHADGFQGPLSSLDPRLPVWRIITEPVWVQKRSSERERRQLAETLAMQVGIRAEYLDRLPHAFSGGQRQRIAIARALSSNPDIIVLDEPTSALDISVQAQILNLLVKLQQERNLTYVLISHNVSVVRHMSDRVAVMYLGQIVELGTTDQVACQAAPSLHPAAA